MADSPVAKFEVAYRECIAQLVPEEPSTGITYQDESRITVEHSVGKFLDVAREVEAMFLKQRLTAANKNPELVVWQEVEELAQEIRQKDEVLKNLHLQLKQWQQKLHDLNKGPTNAKVVSSNNTQTRK